MDVHGVSRPNIFMTEPESDRGFVDPMGEKVHGAAVAQDVRSNRLGNQRWTCCSSSGYVPVDNTPDCITAEALASLPWEERSAITTCSFDKPGVKYRARMVTQRRDPLFAALASATDVCPGAQSDVAAVEPGQLRDAQPSLKGED